jgi:hypothetical protein
MESAEIQSVLYRASELQAKLDSAIARASTATAAATAAAAAELVEEEEEEDDDDDDDDDEGNFGEEERGGENDEIGREHPGNAAAGDSSSQSKAPKSDKQMLGAIRQALVDLHRSLHSLQVPSSFSFFFFLFHFASLCGLSSIVSSHFISVPGFAEAAEI